MSCCGGPAYVKLSQLERLLQSSPAVANAFSLRANSNTPLHGDVTLLDGNGIALTQDSINKTITVTGAVPLRVLFVAQSWSQGADDVTFFTNIQAAVTAAAALSTSTFVQTIVSVAPGNYSSQGAITVPAAASNITVAAMNGIGPLMDSGLGPSVYVGNVIWNPSGSTQSIAFDGIFSLGGAGFTITPAAASSGSTFVLRNCGTSVLVGDNSATTANHTIFTDSSTMGGTNTFTRYNLRTRSSFYSIGLTMTGVGGFAISNITTMGGNIFGSTVTLNTNSKITPLGTSTIRGVGNLWEGNLVVNATCTADIRGDEWIGTLSGAGAIDRSSDNFSCTSASAGTIFVPLYITAPKVQLTCTSAAGGGVPQVSAIGVGGFTLTDGTGGRTFDALVTLK